MDGNKRNFFNQRPSIQFKRKGSSINKGKWNNPSREQFSGNSQSLDTVYRILCPSKKFGGVIGKGGGIIKALREETRSKITVADSVLGSDERVIIIYSSPTKISRKQDSDEDSNKADEQEPMEPHCAAQDALLKVKDRIVEEDLYGGVTFDDDNENIVVTRLLVPNNLVGCLLGQRGDVIQRLRSETCANIRVLPADQLPTCAMDTDELVQRVANPDMAFNLTRDMIYGRLDWEMKTKIKTLSVQCLDFGGDYKCVVRKIISLFQRSIKSMAATVVVPSAIVLKVLNTDNYQDWSFRVKTYLLAKGLWKVVESTMEPPRVEDGEAEYEAWSKKNAEALHAIHISCAEDTFSFIRGIDTAKAAWNTLEKRLKPAGLPKTTDEISEHQSPLMDGVLELKDLKIRPVVIVGHKSNSNAAANDDIYRSFFNLVTNRWKEMNTIDALNFLKEHPETIRRRDPSSGLPALHFALKWENMVIVKELVQLMTEEDWTLLDPSGRTAICCALDHPLDRRQIVECMVEKNKKLLSMVDPSTNMIPLVMAHGSKWWTSRKVTDYLYSATPLETLNARQAAQIISQSFINKTFDISWDLIQRYPSLIITKDLSGKYPLNILAESMKQEELFLSQSGLSFWERWIYDSIVIPPTPTINDISSIIVHDPENDQCKQRRLIHPVTSLFRGLFRRFPGFNRINRMKMLHARIHEFLSCMCEVMKDKDVTQMQDDSLLKSAIFRAVEQGKVEFIAHLCNANPNIYRITNEQDRTMFQFAADCREEKIYGLVFVYYPDDRDRIFSRRDKFDNNMLHIVGSFSSLAQSRMDNIRGAALQMQRERQWFKDVQSLTKPEGFEVINHTDQLPPHAVFTRYHKDLIREGEKSMKETATSCTVVGALVVTMMFAAAFTISGGNNGGIGAPIFLEAKVFMIFIISDAISLFSSTTSVMIFLGILTSRYKEDDFLKCLPTKMIVGLFSLFLSIATMMITFSAALYIMLPGKSWIVIPIILLSGVPITSFVWMQFPFFVEIFVSTYGADIFNRKRNMGTFWD